MTDDASAKLDAWLDELDAADDWRGATLRTVREVVRKALPDVVEEWKWAKATSPGVPVWSQDGIICTGETYKAAVKLTFAKGASVPDPSGLFNSSLDGKVRRAIDFKQGDKVDKRALTKLFRDAAALNAGKA